MATKAMAMVGSRAMETMAVTATMTTPLDTMEGATTTVSIQTSGKRLPDLYDLSLHRSTQSSLSIPADQGNTSYGKTPRRGGHQGSYKPY